MCISLLCPCNFSLQIKTNTLKRCQGPKSVSHHFLSPSVCIRGSLNRSKVRGTGLGTPTRDMNIPGKFHLLYHDARSTSCDFSGEFHTSPAKRKNTHLLISLRPQEHHLPSAFPSRQVQKYHRAHVESRMPSLTHYLLHSLSSLAPCLAAGASQALLSLLK